MLLSSNHQIEFCENVIEKLLRNDAKSLVFFTISGCVETSRNLLKIFSPLIDQLSSSRSQEAAQEPLTLVLPDTDAATVRIMLALLSRGKMSLSNTELAHLQNVLRDVTSLAACLGLELNVNVDTPPPPQATNDETCRGSLLKVRSLKDLLEPKAYNLCEGQNIVNKNEEPEPFEYTEYDDDLMTKRLIVDIATDTDRGQNIGKLRNQEELVSSDENQSLSFSDDSISIGQSEREELRLTWQRKKDSQTGATVTGINNNKSWSCHHEKCHMKFSSIGERNCHEKVHQKFEQFSAKNNLPFHVKRLELERKEMDIILLTSQTLNLKPEEYLHVLI